MKTIVVSAVNLINGGALNILNQCLSFLNQKSDEYKIIALVNNKKLCFYENIEYIEYTYPQKKYVYRLYFEYIHSYFISRKLKPYLWLSLHDVSPHVKSVKKAVYCHNPSPFYNIDFKSSTIKSYLYTKLYKYLYMINIKGNDHVVVQQFWLKNEFVKMFNLKLDQVVVAYPSTLDELGNNVMREKKEVTNVNTTFFYPSFPREFKNFESICEASSILESEGVRNFSVNLTIDGTENDYSRLIVDRFSHLSTINFVGCLSFDAVTSLYSQSDALIFPSKLETWGLPISEFSKYNKPMIIADLPYAHETASSSSFVSFFNPNKPSELALLMKDLINNNLLRFHEVKQKDIIHPFADSWGSLFDILLSSQQNMDKG